MLRFTCVTLKSIKNLLVLQNLSVYYVTCLFINLITALHHFEGWPLQNDTHQFANETYLMSFEDVNLGHLLLEGIVSVTLNPLKFMKFQQSLRNLKMTNPNATMKCQPSYSVLLKKYITKLSPLLHRGAQRNLSE